MNESLLSINNLKTYFYTEEGVVKAVDNVNLKIKKEEVLGLVGESGCGKSTTAISIMRLIRAPGKIAGGEIWFDGEDLLKKSEGKMRKIRGGKISMIFQNPMSSLNPVFTVGGQIAEAIKLHQNVQKREIKEKVAEILDKVGIPDPSERLEDYPHEYSGGMAQRAMIAMALSCNPELLVADEPTTNLDVTIQAQILELMKALRKDFGASILLIGHDLGVISELCDKIAVMYAGKIVENSDLTGIFKKPKHPYTQALLESIPRLDVETERLRIIPGTVPRLINPPSGCRFHPRCEHAMKICSEQEPLLTEIEKEHTVACHLYTSNSKPSH
ncbi:MAG: ABC transporter ATP-binding protein [Candidatus Bathyarchaeota archaeon]|nr:MAG: ABC transporter ATP-binding protein [Candidatus Bathyarchaeota archaeon]